MQEIGKRAMQETSMSDARTTRRPHPDQGLIHRLTKTERLLKPANNPRWLEDCTLAFLIRWESEALAAIDAKARDISGNWRKPHSSFPDNKPGIVHIGFEAVDGDEVEKARYEKIIRSVSGFDPRSKNLEYVFCHYFVPESPPD
jgi:hypothetical protein